MRIKSFDIPQADRLESVVQVIINVAVGAKTDLQIIKNIPYLTTDRQGRYYRKAAEILGFITNNRNISKLTEKGIDFLKNPSINNPILISAVLNIDVIQRLLPYMELHEEGLTRNEIENYLASIVSENIGASMLARRLMTILSWLETIKVLIQKGKYYFLVNKFTDNLPILELKDIEQPILPTSGDLQEYKIVQDRTKKAEDIITIYKNQATLDRAVKAHIRLVNLVAQRIINTGRLPKSNQLIDLAVNIEKDFIFEMKSSDENNVRDQVRKGLSQLYEYRYIQNKPNAILVLALEKPVNKTNKWMIDYLENDRDVLLVWDGSDELYSTPETKSKLKFLKTIAVN